MGVEKLLSIWLSRASTSLALIFNGNVAEDAYILLNFAGGENSREKSRLRITMVNLEKIHSSVVSNRIVSRVRKLRLFFAQSGRLTDTASSIA